MYSAALLFTLGGLVTSCTGQLPKRDIGTKNVFAHFIVGYTYPYTQADWLQDIRGATNAGIDAFALNVGTDSWQPSQVAAAYQAAKSSGTGFKLFISFDMSSLPCTTANNAATLRTYITTYASHPNQFKYNGRVFASTFAGESCTFGQKSVPLGWATQFTQKLTGVNSVYFVPSFFIDPATFTLYNSSINGMYNFNSGWPIQMTTVSVNTQLALYGSSLSATSPSAIEQITSNLLPTVGAIDTDNQYIAGLRSVSSNTGLPPTYIGAVSPWFFTHYGPKSYNKNWIYYSDSHLYNTRWENIITNRDVFDLIEINTWNDYSESHYIGPIHGAQPNSQAWVNGMDHTAWLNMTSYYATAYKTGAYPTISMDRIYVWARPHPKNAISPDPVPKPNNYEMTQDLMWAVVFATSPGFVTLYTSNTNSQTWSVPAGVTKLSLPLTPAGGYMRATLTRNGVVVTDFAPPGYYFQPKPPNYNYNAFTAGSPDIGTVANPGPPSTVYHQIHPNGNPAKCLDVRGSNFAAGTLVQIWDCNGSPAQNWLINPGTTAVHVYGTNYCLSAGSSPTSGTQMTLALCYQGMASQTWYYTSDNRISLQNQGQCLDYTDGNLAAGTVMQIWQCTVNDYYQIWTLS